MKDLEWPSQSVDLNPLEMVWHDFKKVVQAQKLSNVTELKQFCKEEWSLHSDVKDSLPLITNCLFAVVAAKVGSNG